MAYGGPSFNEKKSVTIDSYKKFVFAQNGGFNEKKSVTASQDCMLNTILRRFRFNEKKSATHLSR